MVGELGSLVIYKESPVAAGRPALEEGWRNWVPGTPPLQGWSADNGYTLLVALGTEQPSFFQQTLMRHSLVPAGRHRTILEKLFKFKESIHKPERQVIFVWCIHCTQDIPLTSFLKNACCWSWRNGWV